MITKLVVCFFQGVQQLELSFELPVCTVLASTAADSGAVIGAVSDINPHIDRKYSRSGAPGSVLAGAPDLSNPVLQKIGQKYEINISVDKAPSGPGAAGWGSPFNAGAEARNALGLGEDVPTIVFTAKGAVSNAEKVKTGTQELMDYLTQNYTVGLNDMGCEYHDVHDRHFG